MQRTITHPLFLVPATFLLMSVVVFGLIEYRMEESANAVRDIVNDPEIAYSNRIHDSVWSLREAVENYISFERTDLNRAAAESALIDLRAAAQDLKSFFLVGEEHKVHQVDLQVLTSLEEDLDKVAFFMGDEQNFSDPAVIAYLRKSIGILVDTGHALSRSVAITRQAEYAHFTDQISRDERLRTWLLVMDFFLAVLLVSSLFRTVLRFKHNAQIAWATERYNAFYAAALQSIRVGVLIRDMQRPETPVLFVNNAFTELTGYDLSFMVDKKSDILFGWHTDAGMSDAFRRSLREELARNFEILIYRKNGSSFWCDWHISPVHDKNGKLTHYISLLTDITSMRQTQEALLLAKEQAEHASAVKTSFLATMSHEIRTPINGLLGVLDILSETAMSPEQEKYLQIAINSSQSLHAIINDILDYAKMESGKVEVINEPFSLSDLMQSIVDLADPVASRKGIALKLDMQDGVPVRLEGDAGKIRQITLNLVMNAIKFTDSGSVTMRILPLLSQEKHGRQVALLRFEVVDTGIGISVADQDKLFKEFSQIERSFTRRFGGTGLGLAISKRLVSLMGGEIGLESKQGQGSTFWFMLSLAVSDQSSPVEAVAKEAEPRSLAPIGEPHAVLLVEDNETNQLVASRYLQKAGLSPDVVASGQAALQAVGEKTYDLIFMDISMADMDGFEATRRLRALQGWVSSVPIIALTAHVMPGDRERCLAAGMNDHLEKPINYQSLLRMLKRWLPEEAHTLPDEAWTKEQEKQSVALPVAKAAAFPVPSDAPLFDVETLRALAADLGNEAVLHITEVFLDDSAKRVATFPKTIGEQSLQAFRDTAHTLKSSSASCGIKRFSDRMAEIEAAAKEGDEGRAFALLSGVPALYEASCQALREARAAFEIKDKPRA